MARRERIRFKDISKLEDLNMDNVVCEHFNLSDTDKEVELMFGYHFIGSSSYSLRVSNARDEDWLKVVAPKCAIARSRCGREYDVYMLGEIIYNNFKNGTKTEEELVKFMEKAGMEMSWKIRRN